MEISLVNIRQETASDNEPVFKLIEAAFKDEVHSDHKEQFLVERLRSSDAFIKELSLVAEYKGTIIGHILLTRLIIKNAEAQYPSLALAPVSVHPNRQHKGIGSLLIEKAHNIALKMGFESVILLGHPNYYKRFGYMPASNYNIQLPFDVPPEYCMAIELKPNSLTSVSGMVEYPKEFFE